MLAKCSHTLAAFALLLLASCAQQPLSSIDRTKYKTVALDPDMKAPDHYVYRDITGKRFRGFAGGLIGLMAGAASEGPGVSSIRCRGQEEPDRYTCRGPTAHGGRAAQLATS